MNKKLVIFYWHLTRFKGLEYEHKEERDISELHTIIDAVLASGLNVMIKQVAESDDNIAAVVYISNDMFRQR